MITASLKIKDLSVSEYWDLVIEAIESDNFDLRISAVTDSYADFYVDSSDKDWCLRVQSFEHSIKEKSVINIRSSMQRCVIESVMASNAMQWFSAFIRLDPRQQVRLCFHILLTLVGKVQTEFLLIFKSCCNRSIGSSTKSPRVAVASLSML